MSVRTRFAPSPTGFLHVGGARTALFSWLYARRYQGSFVLRIEDTDVARSTPEAIAAINEGMEWLGLYADEGPYYQTRRFERYQQVINQLLASGWAYTCTCSKERLQQLREWQLENHVKPRYDGRCRARTRPPADDEACVIRFRNPQSGEVAWEDQVKGLIRIANSELDDFVIARSDGTPTYNFCVVVDDRDMRISHVVRGDDHVNNTPRQINLYHALGAPVPVFAHVPMICGEDGKKLSKRHAAVSVTAYRDMGYLPEAMRNYLLRLGWSYGDQEVFSTEESIALFDLGSVQPAPAAFNAEKLNWLNQYYMRTLPVERVAEALQWQFERLGLVAENGPSLLELVPVMAGRVKTLAELAEQSRYFYEAVTEYQPGPFKKHMKAAAVPVLETVVHKLETLDTATWQDGSALHQLLVETAAAHDVKMAKVGMPVRVAITGGGQSPDIGITMKLIGRERVIGRLYAAIRAVYARINNAPA